MAVLGRLLISSAERLDLPDLLSIDSYTAGDFKYLLKGLVGDTKPFVLKGFDVIDPQNAVGTQSCSIRVAESVVFYPGSTAGPFFHGLAEGHTQAQPVVPELRKNAVNYVYLTFSTFNSSVDTRAFWDPDKDGGVGGEFTQDVNTESVLKCDVNVSVGSFPSNTIPIAKITVGPVVITAIEDARDLMFRLGSGGISPNPYNVWNWRSLPNGGYERLEPPTTMTAGGDNPFQGADKNIWTLKEWMDAVMSKLQELGGTTYWYEDASTYSLIASFVDALATTFKSKGQWQHDSSTPGLVTWTEDINIKVASDPRTYIIRNGSKTLADEQVAYLSLIRNNLLNASDQVVSWTNAQNYINTVGGSVGLFANLAKGDYVRKINDPRHYYLRVEEFYDSVSLGGSTTTAANAKSVRLSGNYLGTTANEKGRYDKGVYQSSDVVVSNRDDAAITTAGGNFHWLALRSDTIENTSNIVTTSLSIDITEHDGLTAKVESIGTHGLVDNDRVTITTSVNFNGTYQVEVESSTVFYIQKTGGTFADETGRAAHYATVTTAARSTTWGLQLESANHGFNTDDTVILSNTTNYNGSFKISVRDANTFTIPVSSTLATETSGLATLARVVIRLEEGTTNLVQGESAEIGGSLASNIKQFLGMTSDSQVHPNYAVPLSYDTLDGMANYNSSSSDNVTDRLSKLTSMMADKAQDKTAKYLVSSGLIVTNTTNGAAQEITFDPAGSSLTIQLPGSPGNAVIALPNTSPGISLLGNQVAYVVIDRNAVSAPSITVVNRSACPVGENVFVIASRLTGSDVWLWNGDPIVSGSSTPIFGSAQDRNTKLVKGGVWSWNSGTSTLAWTANAYVQVPGVSEVRNTILAGSSTALASDGDCLYVNIVRTTGGATNLSILSANILSVPNNNTALIIARRNGNDVLVGNGTILLINGESKELEAGLSVENRALIGAGVTEATSNPGYAARGAVNRITSDAEGALDAIARHDAEFDKYLGLFRLIAKTSGNKRRVRVTGAERVVFTGETLTQEMGSLRVSFTGAEIDFQTGEIFGGDATLPLSTDFVTPLGVDFTPASIVANQYLWYSIAGNPAGTNGDNTINVQFNVIAGTSGVTPTAASKPALGGLKKLGYVVVKDNGSGGSGTILEWDNAGFTLPAAAAQAKIAQLGVGTGSGGGAGLQKVRLHNPSSTTLPTGAVTIDNISVDPDDLVLFSNLSVGDNKIYKAVGTIGNITSWQSQFMFEGSDSPGDGDTVIVTEGDSFEDQIGKFNGTEWVFNDKIRYFNGADYWEQSNLNSTALADNQAVPADIFAINWSGSENLWVDYSITRGTTKETGTIKMTTDGVDVGIASDNVDLAVNAGILFSGVISGAQIKLQYTSTASGSAGQMKWTVKRWSDSAGGPGGIPSYSGGGGGSITGSGSAQQIAIWSSPTNVTGNSNFTIDTGAGVLKLGTVEHTVLNTANIQSGVQSNDLLFTYSTAFNFAVIEYSITKGAGNLRQGILNITQDAAANINITDTYSEIGVSEVVLASPAVTHTINGALVEVRYNSSGGVAGTFKYAVRRWS